MAKLFILVGLPGAGKSTYCKTKLSKYAHISPDQILQEKSETGQKIPYQEAFHIACRIMNQMLSNGTDVVFDAANITKRERTEIIAINPMALPQQPYTSLFLQNTVSPGTKSTVEKSLIQW